MLKNVPDLIEALGGNQAVADLRRVSAQAVCNWKSKGWIPPRHHPGIERALAAKGLRAPLALFDLNAD